MLAASPPLSKTGTATVTSEETWKGKQNLNVNQSLHDIRAKEESGMNNNTVLPTTIKGHLLFLLSGEFTDELKTYGLKILVKLLLQSRGPLIRKTRRLAGQCSLTFAPLLLAETFLLSGQSHHRELHSPVEEQLHITSSRACVRTGKEKHHSRY